MLVLLATVLLFAAKAADKLEPADTLADLASALSRNNAVEAVKAFDPAMSGYSSIEANIEAITAQSDVLCSIEVLDEKSVGEERELDVDWYLQLRSQIPNAPTERRRERLTLRLKLMHGKWRISAISLPKILAPQVLN